MKAANRRQQGFTLVEIGLVLAVIGLLLGGILKGQEMINNAKVRQIADRQNSLKSAVYMFHDRFGAWPGDFDEAADHIAGAANGDGSGSIEGLESAKAFQHLTAAGYLRCGHCTETRNFALQSSNNSPVNIYGGVMALGIGRDYAVPTSGSGTRPFLQAVFTGPRIPSNIMAELDRKIDDGIPNTGDLRFNSFTSGAQQNAPDVGECTKRNAAGTRDGTLNGRANFWRPANARPPVFGNCGGSIFI